MTGSFDFDIPNIKYNFNSSGVNPADMQYLCVRFGKGDHPNQKHHKLPFTVTGVCNSNGETKYTDALTVCQDIPTNSTGKMISRVLS